MTEGPWLESPQGAPGVLVRQVPFLFSSVDGLSLYVGRAESGGGPVCPSTVQAPWADGAPVAIVEPTAGAAPGLTSAGGSPVPVCQATEALQDREFMGPDLICNGANSYMCREGALKFEAHCQPCCAGTVWLWVCKAVRADWGGFDSPQDGQAGQNVGISHGRVKGVNPTVSILKGWVCVCHPALDGPDSQAGHRLWGLGQGIEVNHLKSHPIPPSGDLQGARHHLLHKDVIFKGPAHFCRVHKAAVLDRRHADDGRLGRG